MKFHFKCVAMVVVLVKGILSKSLPDESQYAYLSGEHDVETALKAYYKQLEINGTDIQKIVAKQILNKLQQNDNSPFPGTNPVFKGGAGGILQTDENKRLNDEETPDNYNELEHSELLPNLEDLDLQKAINGQPFISEENMQRETDIALNNYFKQMETNGTELDREIAKAYVEKLQQDKDDTQDVSINPPIGISSYDTPPVSLTEQPDSTRNIVLEDTLEDKHSVENVHQQNHNIDDAVPANNTTTHNMSIPIPEKHSALIEDGLNIGQGDRSVTIALNTLTGDIKNNAVVLSTAEPKHERNNYGHDETNVNQNDMHPNMQSDNTENNVKLKGDSSTTTESEQGMVNKTVEGDRDKQPQYQHVTGVINPTAEGHLQTQFIHKEPNENLDNSGHSETEHEHEISNVEQTGEDTVQMPSIHMGANVKLGGGLHLKLPPEHEENNVYSKPPKHIELNLKPENGIHLNPGTEHTDGNMQLKDNTYPEPRPGNVDVIMQQGNTFPQPIQAHSDFNLQPSINLHPTPKPLQADVNAKPRDNVNPEEQHTENNINHGMDGLQNAHPVVKSTENTSYAIQNGHTSKQPNKVTNSKDTEQKPITATSFQSKLTQTLTSIKSTTVIDTSETPLQTELHKTVSPTTTSNTVTRSTPMRLFTTQVTSRQAATHSPADNHNQRILFQQDHTTKKACSLFSYGHYDQSAVIGAAVGGAFVGGFTVLALVYCKQKCRKYRLGDYRRVPLEYDFELNPRLKTSNF